MTTTMHSETATEVRIRRANRDDMLELCGLLMELAELEPDFDVEPGRARLGLEAMMDEPGAAVFVAEAGGEVCGMCTVQGLVSTAEGGRVGLVEDVVVKEGMRRRGIGHALVTAADNWAKAHSLRRLQLLADMDNVAALKFYKDSGWHGTRMICLRKKQS